MTFIHFFSIEEITVFDSRNLYFPSSKIVFSPIENSVFRYRKQTSVMCFRSTVLCDDRHNLRSNCRREPPIHNHSS